MDKKPNNMEMRTKITLSRSDFKQMAIYFAAHPTEQSIDIDIDVPDSGDKEPDPGYCPECLDPIQDCVCERYYPPVPRRPETAEEKMAREAREFLISSGIDF